MDTTDSFNQSGESALKDEVSRHYVSTFAAAGAIGALSGLTLAGGSPYGLRAGVGPSRPMPRWTRRWRPSSGPLPRSKASWRPG